MRKRNKHISVWMNEQEYAYLKRQAALSGLGIDPFIRNLVRGVEIRAKTPDCYNALLRELSAIGTMAAKRTQSRSSPPMSGCSHIRKNFVYFSKNIPRGSFTIKKCFDRIKAQFIHSQSSNAKTVSRYLGEEVA